MRLKDCTLGQKVARVVFFTPVILAGVGYLFAGLWFCWIIMR